MTFHPSSLTCDPLIQRKRHIVGIHTKTIDHVAGDLSRCPVRTYRGSFPCDRLKPLQEPLILRVMHMAIKHVYFGIPIFIHTVLAIVAHDGIMAEDHLSLIVLQFLIGLDPHKPTCVIVFVLQKPVVVSLDQIQASVEPLQQLIGFFRLSPRQIPQYNDLVILPHFSVPLRSIYSFIASTLSKPRRSIFVFSAPWKKCGSAI